MNDSSFPSPPASPAEAPKIAFRPVRMKQQRRDGWSPARQALFLIYLEQLGIVTAAAKAVGMSARSAYRLLHRSEVEQAVSDEETGDAPSFAEAWHNAVDQGEDNAIEIAFKRAIDGELRPILYRGRVVGQKRIYDNRLLCAALNKQRAGKKQRDTAEADAGLAAFIHGGDEA